MSLLGNVVLRVVPLAGLLLPAANDSLRTSGDAERSESRYVADARVPPFSSVGKLNGVMICTGTLVLDPRIVVTAAHCVLERDSSRTRSDVIFRPGYQNGSDLGSVAGRVVSVGSQHQFEDHSPADEAQDWAIVLLEAPLSDLRPLRLQRVIYSERLRMNGLVMLPAYSADIADGETLSVDRHCSIGGIRWGVFLHDCQASDGASGAPLLVERDGEFLLIGINTGALFPVDADGRSGEMNHAAVSVSSFEAALKSALSRLAHARQDTGAIQR
ncbi:MAG: trypsin-like peptidase domain-containing protein [Proteobacteria bacterium]|nr:trypsin-like peptidase domain-containing protein [Pseudomonadota bacterium]